MRFTIVADDEAVGVDGVFKRVSLQGLDPEIYAVQFDTELGTGEIEFKPSAKRSVVVRDFDAEEEEERQLKAKNKKSVGAARNKTKLVPKENEQISSMARFNAILQRWNNA